MIQRVQSIFIFLTFLLLSCTFFFDLWDKNIEEGRKVCLNLHGLIYTSDLHQIKYIKYPYIISFALNTIACLLSIVQFIFFKKRKIQIKIAKIINLIIMSILIKAIVESYIISFKIDYFSLSELKVGYLLLICALLTNSQAKHYINEDEKLVKSADRLR